MVMMISRKKLIQGACISLTLSSWGLGHAENSKGPSLSSNEYGAISSIESVQTTSAPSESIASRKMTSSVTGEGQTLPQGVMRARALYRFAHSEKSFADAGAAQSSGFTFQAQAAAAIVEYGITPAISLQAVVQTVLESQLSLDGGKFTGSRLYKKNYTSFLEGVAEKLVESGLCESVSVCVEALDKQNLSLPYNKDVVLASGETLTLKQGIPVKTYAAPFILNSIVPKEGRTGLGDVETGVLVAVAHPDVGYIRDWSTRMSAGVGVRWPTGSFVDVPRAQRATGRGVTDLGIRMNLDHPVGDSLMFSFQNQTEVMILECKKKRPSLVQSTELNRADPTVTGADGVANNAAYTRESQRHTGFLKAAWHAGAASELLQPVLLNAFIKYDLDNPGELGGKSLGDASKQYSAQVGVTLDGLRLSLPVQLDLDYEVPFFGENKPVAAQVLSATLKAFYRF